MEVETLYLCIYFIYVSVSVFDMYMWVCMCISGGKTEVYVSTETLHTLYTYIHIHSHTVGPMVQHLCPVLIVSSFLADQMLVLLLFCVVCRRNDAREMGGTPGTTTMG